MIYNFLKKIKKFYNDSMKSYESSLLTPEGIYTRNGDILSYNYIRG